MAPVVIGGGGAQIPPVTSSGVITLNTTTYVMWLAVADIPPGDFWIEGWIAETALIDHQVPLQLIRHDQIFERGAGAQLFITIGQNDAISLFVRLDDDGEIEALALLGVGEGGDFHWTIREVLD